MADEQSERRISSWSDLFVKTIELGLGAATLTAETAQKLVNDLVNRGQMTREEGGTMVDRLVSVGHNQREQLREVVEKATERVMDRMDLARKSDLDELRKRLEALELAVLGQTTPMPPITPYRPEDLNENE